MSEPTEIRGHAGPPADSDLSVRGYRPVELVVALRNNPSTATVPLFYLMVAPCDLTARSKDPATGGSTLSLLTSVALATLMFWEPRKRSYRHDGRRDSIVFPRGMEAFPIGSASIWAWSGRPWPGRTGLRVIVPVANLGRVGQLAGIADCVLYLLHLQFLIRFLDRSLCLRKKPIGESLAQQFSLYRAGISSGGRSCLLRITPRIGHPIRSSGRALCRCWH